MTAANDKKIASGVRKRADRILQNPVKNMYRCGVLFIGDKDIRVVFTRTKNANGYTVKCILWVLGLPPVVGQATGCGYDMETAAFHGACDQIYMMYNKDIACMASACFNEVTHNMLTPVFAWAGMAAKSSSWERAVRDESYDAEYFPASI